MSRISSSALLIQLARDVRDRFDCLREGDEMTHDELERHAYHDFNGDDEGCLHCMAEIALGEGSK